MSDVFISYSRENQAFVQRIADGVNAAGYAIWWDEHLPAHRSYGDVITEQIQAARAVIVIWSHSAAASEWVRAEADMARNQRKLIQATLDDVALPLPFNQIQYASLADWQGQADHPGWQKILASLAALTGNPQTASAAVPRAPTVPATSRKPGRTWLIAAALLALILFAGVAWMLAGKSAGSVEPATVTQAEPSPGEATPAESAPSQVVDIPNRSTLPPASAISNGEAVPPEADVVPPQGKARLLFPYMAEQLLTIADLDPLTVAQLGMTRNEILAHAGHRFASPALNAWFRQFDWYHPKDGPVVLDSMMRANMASLVEEENTR
jgi:hypothetical protein